MKDITVLTPVYINVEERWNYLAETLNSFSRCNLSHVKITHNMVDDGSPLHGEELPEFCRQRGINLVRQFRRDQRRGFYDVFKLLVNSVATEHFIYLEPDHFFYLPADFITPILKMFDVLPDLHQVYLRAPLINRPFRRDGRALITHDGTRLHRLRIDGENTGWIGAGCMHETFSLMPSVFNTELMKSYLQLDFVPGGPSEVEGHFADLWARKAMVGYLNAQAFCYHIGAAGGAGPGGFLSIGDKDYESAWSAKWL